MVNQDQKESPPEAEVASENNGHDTQAEQRRSAAPNIKSRLTQEAVHPADQPSPFLGQSRKWPQQRAPGEHKVESARHLVDELRSSEEADDHDLIITRTTPSFSGGKNNVQLQNPPERYRVMAFDDLYENIIAAWGGGRYEIKVAYKGTDKHNVKYPLRNFPIDLNQYPVKVVKGESIDDSDETGERRSVESFDDEEIRAKKAERAEAAAGRLADAATKRAESERKRMMAEALANQQMKMIMNEGKDNGNKEIMDMFSKTLANIETARKEENARQDNLRIQQEQQRREERADQERRLEKLELQRMADKKDADDKLERLLSKMSEPKKDDTGTMILLESMKAQNQSSIESMKAQSAAAAENMKAMVAIMVGQPKNNDHLEMMRLQNETSKQTTEAQIKIASRENSQQQQMFANMQSMTNNLMQILMSKSDGGIEQMMKFMDYGKKQMKDGIDMAREMNDGVGGEAAPGEAWYIPVLKGVFSSAVGNPVLMQGLMKMFNFKTQPTEDQVLKKAQEADQRQQGMLPENAYQGSLPPPVGIPAVRQQFRPQSIMTPPPVQQQGVGVQQFIQQQVPAANTQQPTNEVQIEANVLMSDEDQIEASFGVAGDPVPDQEPTPATAVPPVTTPALEGSSKEETPEERLKFFVTDTIKEAIKDIADGREVHVWPMDAKQYWPLAFKQAIVEEKDPSNRMTMIRNQCEPEIWKQFYDLTEDDSNLGKARFFAGLAKFVELCLEPQEA